jgi:hypothetical protein
MTEPTAAQEREAIVAWLVRYGVNGGEKFEGPTWRRVIWSLFHPSKFGETYGHVMCAYGAIQAIERGDHHKEQST